MARLKGLCASALVLVCVISAAQSADKCRTGCHGVTPNVFKYQDGTTYKYNLEGNIDISLSSAENQHTSTKITGTALLTQQANCNQILRLQNIQIIGPDAKKYAGIENIDKSIRLNFHDGHIEDEICTEPGDTINSINIKRAVASMFQAALKATEETDVFGKCPNDISSRKEGNYVIIQKTRDLTRCSHRESIKQDFLATSFNIKAVAGASPMISNFESEQKVKNGILETATVTENYLYKPLSDGKEHGVKAIITTKLTLAGQSKDKVAAKATEPKQIYFENPHLDPVRTTNVDGILNALKETKNTMDVSVSENSAKTFYQLINVLRESRKDDILAVYGQVKTGAGGFKDKEGARKVFFDALFRAGTGDAVEVVIELLKNKEMSPMEQKLVYLSFSFIKHATKGSLLSAAALLDQPDLPREAYLGIGTLAGRYCHEHSCAQVDELNKLMQKLTAKLVVAPADRKAENEVIAVLKALGNVGHLSDAAVEKITQIAANQKNAPLRLRVAALEAARTDACHQKLTTAALNILKNRNEDSEIRIKAYLVVAECPDAKSAQAIQELLDTEPVYQVGGYIMSHLRNLRASTNPDRERSQQYLNQIHSKNSKHFPIDPRKYSFNGEVSYNWDTLGSGNVLESDVIYSQQSYLPRSVHLNVTSELFGHSFNMFEIGVRQENLDKLVEHYFGPLGVFSTEKPEDLYKTGKKSMQKIVEHMKQRFEHTRTRRDTKAEIDAFDKQVKIVGSELNKDLEYDLSLKLFGSEMLFLSLNENIEQLTPDGIIDKFFDCVDKGLDKAKNFEYHLKNHVLFMDTEISYPTSMGFPLKWYLQGTAAVHFITSGAIDVKQILKDPKNAEIKLKVVPSANIVLTAGITFDAQIVRTGIQANTNILTSTGTDVTFKLLDNKGVDVKVGLPVEKQKLISFSHQLEFASQEQGKKEHAIALKFKDKQKEFSVCFDQLSPMIGLNFCGELISPSTLQTNHVAFPLNGHVKLEVMIERDDVSEYHFKALLKEPNAHSKQIEVTFATPGSKQNRDVTLLLEAATQPNKVLRAVLKSPLKEATAEAVLTDTPQEKSAMLRFQHDTQEYLAKIGVAVKGTDAKQIYEPLIEYQTPNDIVKTKGPRKSDYTVEGQVTVEKTGDNRKFNFEHIKLIAPGQPPIQINGHLAKEGPTTYSADLEVSRESVTIHGKGRVAYDPNSVKLNAEMQNSVNPNANFNIKMDLKKGEREFDSSIQLIHGKDLSSKKHQLTIQNSAKYKYENKDNFDFSTKNKVQYPLLNIEGKLDGHATRHLVAYDLTIAYDKFKLESELEAKHCQKEFGDYDVKFELEAMANKLQLKAKRDITGDKSSIENSLEITGRKYSLDGTVTHHVKPNDVNVGCDVTIKVHDKPDAIKINTGLITNPKELDSHAKITIGATNVVDVVIKGVRSATNPTGTLKVYIKDLITSNGNFKVAAGKGNGDLLIEIPKMERKIKADTSFTCQSPTHNIALNIFFDFEKDNTKKLHLESNNEITKQTLASKNTLELMDYKMSGNINGKLDGEFNNGKLTGDAEIILPNHHILSGTIDRDFRNVDHVVNANGHINLAHQTAAGGPKRTFDLKVQVKDSNFEKRDFDITYHLEAVNTDAANIKADIELKHGHDGEKHKCHFKSKVYGSVLANPLETEMNGEYSREEATHKSAITYGPKMGLKVNTAYKMHAESPCLCNLEIEAITPNEKYSNLKLKMDAKSTIPKDHAEGTYEGETTIMATLNNDKSVKLHGAAQANLKTGKFVLDVTLPDNEPLGVAGEYSREKTETGGKIHGQAELKYAKDKQIKAGLTLNKINEDEMDFQVQLATPNDHAKNIDLHVTNKKSSNNKQFHTEIKLSADDKKYALVNDLLISDISPSLDFKLTHPDGKVTHILAKFNRIDAKHYNGEIKVENVKDFNLEAAADADLESVDNFHIKMSINSEKLKLDKVKIEVFNKSNKGGKKIQFEAKSGTKNLLSGSTTYKSNEEGGKFIVEGSGTVKVKEESKTATFKYIKHQLQQDKDGEQGMNIVLNAAIGNQGIVGELKLSNKQFRLKNSYCEEKQQCAYVEICSKTNAIDAAEFSHDLEMNMDLRKLGLSHEFGLKAVTNRKNFVLDHTVDIHFESSANSKYRYSLFIHPREAGVQFTTPKRQISLEAKGVYDYKKGDTKTGKVNAEVAFYMNKKAEPNKKAVLSYNCDHGFDETSGHAKVEMKFTNPGMSKEMIITHSSKYDLAKKTSEFVLDLDVFAKKNQKLTITGKVNADKIDGGYKAHADISIASKGLNLDVKIVEDTAVSTKELNYDMKLNYQLDKTKLENQVTAKVNAKKVDILIKALNKCILQIDSNMELSKDSQVVDTSLNFIALGEYLTHTEIKNMNTFIHTVAKKATPQNKFKISSGFILGQIADFRVGFDKQGQKNEILHASIKLDDANFMKPDFGMNSEFIEKGLVPAIRNDMSQAMKNLKTMGEDYSKTLTGEAQHLVELAKKSMPNLKPSAEYYKQELIKLKDELISDKTLQEIGDFLKKIFGAVAHTVSEIYTKLNEFSDKLVALGSESFAKITDVIAKDVLPTIKEIGGKLLDVYMSLMKSLYDLVMLYVVRFTEILKAHQAEIKHAATVLSEAFQDFGRLFVKFFNQIKDDAQVVAKNLYDQLKALPIFEDLKERYEHIIQGLPVPDQFVHIIEDVTNTIKDVMPTEELKHFVKVVQDYIAKKMRKETIDDMEALKQIYDSLVKAINSLVKFVQNQQASGAPDYKTLLDNIIPVRFDRFYGIPQITAAKFSPINYMMAGDVPSIRQFLNGQSLRNILPPFTDHAVIVQGQHIFTFDQRHLTFPGKCNYILAKDIINGNFTIVGQYKDGHLEAITFADKHDLVTIKASGKVTLNNKDSELPVRNAQLEVFRLYDTVHLISKAGVTILMEPNLNAVGFYVSGFYHGQIRGLLGNANNEPYDDFIQPNGKITEKEADFGNSYRLSAKCGEIKTVDHHHDAENEKCEELFNREHSYAVCYPFIDRTIYKQACSHGLASGIADTEKYIAFAFVAECRSRGIPVHMPKQFLKCTNGPESRQLNDAFSVKTPSKSADIVVVVEQNKNNEAIFKELVQPVITQLANELNAKGINDIEYSLMGYGGEYPRYPSHYTNGGKLAFNAKLQNLKFTDAAPHVPVDVECTYANELLERVHKYVQEARYQLMLTPEVDALRESLNYPFRAGAARVIIFVKGTNQVKFSPMFLLSKYVSIFGIDDGIHMNLVTPLEHLKLTGKESKQAKNIVGFTEKHAYTVADAKSRNDQHSAELQKNLDYGLDYGVNYFVGRHHGNVFSATNFQQAKGQKKNFIQVMSQMIAEKILGAEYGFDCKCERNGPFSAKNVCKVAKH